MGLFVAQKSIMQKNIEGGLNMKQDSVKMSDLERSRHAREILARKKQESEMSKEDISYDWDERNTTEGTESIIETQTEKTPSESTGTELTQQSDCIQQSQPLSQEVSHSMNLINDSAMQLKGLMTGLFKNEPTPDVKLLDVHKVETAVSCARQITELLRLKKDLIGEVREWYKLK